MARESVQKKLTRVRPPRVQISYDVQVGDAIEIKAGRFRLQATAFLSAEGDSLPCASPLVFI